ncbi:hypothetical protein [Roseibium polysiphoniae]|uniref:hypothetical protein n=1 Tax=Roseibium polysiphoniae TaxID=2571221 RepID=UPI001BCEC0C1|nr:hypothetical protein [Roseibium polysiphoniae]
MRILSTLCPLALVALMLALAGPAGAYQQFTTYRIAGKDIVSVTVGEQQVEDPASLILKLAPSAGEASEITIFSDGDLDECQTNLGYIIGSKTDYVEIVVDDTARTMNGVMVIQCATFFGLFGDGLE